MKKEWIKTIVLIFLVVTSVVFTTRLWSYPSQYETLKASPTPRSVIIDQSFKIQKIIRPYLFIQNKDGEYKGTNHESDVNDAYDLIRNSTLDHIKVVTKNSHRGIPSQGNDESYTLVFPGQLSRETLLQIFNFNSNKLSQVSPSVKIDRLTIYQSKGTPSNEIVVFQDGNVNKFFALIDEDKTFNQLNSAFNLDRKVGTTISYSPVKLKTKPVFLPLHSIQVPEASYIYRTEDPYKFVEAYFNDPENALYSNGLYSDGVHQLKKKGPVLLYVNPSNDTVENTSDPIMESYNFLNSHSEWTDDYIFEGMTHDPKVDDSEVIFRMQKGDYPVFSTGYYPYEYASEIDLKWEKGYLHQVNRTLLNLDDYDIDFSDTNQTLESGHEILREIEEQKNINPKNLEDLRIGYALDPLEKTEKLDLIPEWFYKINGEWYPSYTPSTNQPMPQKNIMGGN